MQNSPTNEPHVFIVRRPAADTCYNADKSPTQTQTSIASPSILHTRVPGLWHGAVFTEKREAGKMIDSTSWPSSSSSAWINQHQAKRRRKAFHHFGKAQQNCSSYPGESLETPRDSNSYTVLAFYR